MAEESLEVEALSFRLIVDAADLPARALSLSLDGCVSSPSHQYDNVCLKPSLAKIFLLRSQLQTIIMLISRRCPDLILIQSFAHLLVGLLHQKTLLKDSFDILFRLCPQFVLLFWDGFFKRVVTRLLQIVPVHFGHLFWHFLWFLIPLLAL